MVRYVFKADEPLRIKNASAANPQAIGEAFEEIAAANGGEIKPHLAVKAAEAQDHPLHTHLEWDDRVCGQAYREDQVRQLIRLIRIDTKPTIEPPRAFLSAATNKGVAYHPLDRVLNNVALQLSVLERADADLRAFEQRYKHLQEICVLVSTAREKLRARIARERKASENRAN